MRFLFRLDLSLHDPDPANGGTDSTKELTDLNLGGCRRPQMGGASDLSFQD